MVLFDLKDGVVIVTDGLGQFAKQFIQVLVAYGARVVVLGSRAGYKMGLRYHRLGGASLPGLFQQ